MVFGPTEHGATLPKRGPGRQRAVLPSRFGKGKKGVKKGVTQGQPTSIERVQDQQLNEMVSKMIAVMPRHSTPGVFVSERRLRARTVKTRQIVQLFRLSNWQLGPGQLAFFQKHVILCMNSNYPAQSRSLAMKTSSRKCLTVVGVALRGSVAARANPSRPTSQRPSACRSRVGWLASRLFKDQHRA